MAGTDDNKTSQRQPAGKFGRWFWLVGLLVGVVCGTAVAVGFTSFRAATEQAK